MSSIPKIRVSADGWLSWNDEARGAKRVRCALGRSGVHATKQEGDGRTPEGSYPLRRLFYRADRLAKPDTRLPCRALRVNDGWCDDPESPAYNRFIRLPASDGHERLWREDHLYDVIVVLGHNDAPPVPGSGSAIFLHVAKGEHEPTEGCVALDIDVLLELLRSCEAGDVMAISAAEQHRSA